MIRFDISKIRAWMRKYRQSALSGMVIAVFLLAGAFFSINYYIERAAAPYIYPVNEAEGADAVLILGAYVRPDGTLSDMLEDRVTVGYELYTQGKAPKLIVSGDHGSKDYDEVNSMKDFLKNKGLPGKDIFMDHAGFSTYESLYRARDIFQAEKLIIVTQRYHLYRAVFIARKLGLEAYGVSSDLHYYGTVMSVYETREMLARNKDFWLTVFKPKPTFLGDTIPVSGDGNATDDKI